AAFGEVAGDPPCPVVGAASYLFSSGDDEVDAEVSISAEPVPDLCGEAAGTVRVVDDSASDLWQRVGVAGGCPECFCPGGRVRHCPFPPGPPVFGCGCQHILGCVLVRQGGCDDFGDAASGEFPQDGCPADALGDGPECADAF